MSIELKRINDNKTRAKLGQKSYSDIIELLKFIGAKPIKENRIYCYFEFDGDMSKTRDMFKLLIY